MLEEVAKVIYEQDLLKQVEETGKYLISSLVEAQVITSVYLYLPKFNIITAKSKHFHIILFFFIEFFKNHYFLLVLTTFKTRRE